MANHEVDLKELEALAVDVAVRAGALLLGGWGQLGRVVTTKSSPTDLVSDMDKAAEDLLVSSISAARPDDGFLGEEGADHAGTSGVRWILDPLDGTVNYLYGLPAWAVSVACEIDGEVCVGVVHDPVLATIYCARRGAGARRDGSVIACSDVTEPPMALIATGFAYDERVRERQGEIVGRIVGRVRDIRRIGSAALDLCHVAEGAVDGYFERGPREWDVAAGGLIATEAGATLSWDGSFVACANETLLERLELLGIR